MRLYVESNFVLEHALAQEEAETVARLLEAAEGGLVHLCLPSFALFEPMGTVTKRARDRHALQRGLRDTQRDLQRSEHLAEAAAMLSQFVSLLVEGSAAEETRLEVTMVRIVAVATLTPFDGSVLQAAFERRDRYGLKKLQDAIVLSSVAADLERRPLEGTRAVFLSRDGDFDASDIRRELRDLGAEVATSFAQALVDLDGR